MDANGSKLSMIVTVVLALMLIGRGAPQLREGVAVVRGTSLSLFRWCYESPLALLKCAADTPSLLFAIALWLLLMGGMIVLCTTYPSFVIVGDWMSAESAAALPALHVKLGILACYLFGARVMGVALRTLKSGRPDGGSP